MESKNAKGDYATWDYGVVTGYEPVDYVNGIMVLAKTKATILEMIAAAKKDGVNLTFAKAFVTYKKALAIRKNHVIDKTKVNDETYLKEAEVDQFAPVTGKPGFTKHQSGKTPAIDWNTTGQPKSYAWLVKNAIRWGMIRTVGSERWHWEIRPGVDQFKKVPKEDPTWDKLV